MKHRILSRRMRIKPLFIALLAAGLPLTASAAEQLRYHNDYRHTVKMVLEPAQANSKSGLRDEALAREFLRQHAEQFGLPTNLANLQLAKTRQSLTATHYHFQQMLNGVPVLHGEAIVSIGKKDGRVIRSYNNTYPATVAVNKTVTAKMTREQALERAWDYVQGAGELLAAPKSELYYVNIDDKLVLAYRTTLAASQTPGRWEHIVDASTGEILRARRLELPNKSAANPAEFGDRWPAAAKNAAHRPLQQALTAWNSAQKTNTSANAVALVADGSAQVFDPDPLTTLNNNTLHDDSVIPDGAYQTRTLRDITFTGATHTLVGPWVHVAQISAPATAASTEADGVWTATRGDNAFNDANTYFHIDQSQRYIQSLGFTGATGIQEDSIAVDTDALDGDDNSQFDPNLNSLEFGHGCVDDNEDADVILHEYGHGLQWSINNNWGGGDTGAMGEGFGDYWAGSYSFSTPNGATFDPAKIFTWDGTDPCWDGRRMDRTSFQYNPDAVYGAHQTVGGILGDELWSTPLFQSLVALNALGVPREEVDQIILDAHFGLGANVTMPEMALAILQSAQDLFPAGQHRAVFLEKFQQVNILTADGNQAPVARVNAATVSVAAGGSVTMNASTSTDANGDTLSYSWAQTGGSAVTLTGANTAQASFTAPSSAATLNFQVTVSDGNGGSDTATVTVTVTASSGGTGGDGGGGGGGSTGLFGLVALALLGWRRKIG